MLPRVLSFLTSRDKAATGSQPIRTKTTYRPDIDGLRAFAVAFVIAFHCFAGKFPGGFVGVDIFFVISGFLITKIILEGIETGKFTLQDFYVRRIRRIFPSLIVVLVACYVLGWFVLLGEDYKNLGKHIMSGVGFVSNLVFWQESGYFDQASDEKPLLHLWSLGVEEQFYIFWPLCLLLFVKLHIKPVFFMLFVALSSFIVNIGMIGDDQMAAFYLPLSRVWQLSVGGVLAYVEHERRNSFLKRVIGLCREMVGASLNVNRQMGNVSTSILSFLGFLFCFGSVFGLSRDVMYPGWWALFPTLGAAMIIASGPRALLNKIVLSHPLVVGIGLISFPLYLWHWPLLSFFRLTHSRWPEREETIIIVLISFVLSVMTYFFVEKRLRFGGHKRAKVTALCLSMAFIGCLGAATYMNDGMLVRLPPSIQALSSLRPDTVAAYRFGSCLLERGESYRGFEKSRCVDPPMPGAQAPLVLIWGDSHAAHLYPGFRQAAEGKVRLAQFTTRACPPFLGLDRAAPPLSLCHRVNEYVMGEVHRLKPDVVVLSAVWGDYDGATYLPEAIKAIKAAGVKKIVIVGSVPLWDEALPRLVGSHMLREGLKEMPTRLNKGFRKDILGIDAAMKDLASRHDVSYFSSYDTLCNVEGCLVRSEEDEASLTAFDYGHLTASGSKYVVEALLKHIQSDSSD